MIASLGAAAFLMPDAAPSRIFDIDAAQSHATIEVGKSGPLSFMAGHTHEVDAPGIHGRVRLLAGGGDVTLIIPVSSMKVVGEHESANDVPKIQQTMMSDEVLDAQNHPTISFQSTSAAIRSQTSEALDTVIDGRLTIRGTARAVSVPVHVDLSGRMFTATGRLSIRQSDYGIKPVSVGGVVVVKDTIAISFHIAGRQVG